VATQQAQSAKTGILTGSVPPLASGFLVRSETDAELESKLAPGTTVALVSARPAGDGGVGRGWRDSSGKTQLAVSCAQSLRERAEVDLVVWVTATSRASVLSGYAEAAAAVGGQVSGDADSVAARFVGWLRDSGRPWLVVLDDLTASAALDDALWPTGPAGRVLVTTADAATHAGLSGRGAQVVPVGAFSRREGLAYLTGRLTADLDQRQGAIDLVGDLDGEPLALAQSSAVIASSELTCHDYREHFVHRRDQTADSAGGTPAASAITWSLSVDQAELLSSGAAQPLLVLAALLDYNAFPGAVLATRAAREYATAGGRVQAVTDGLAALEYAGLLSAAEAPAGSPSPSPSATATAPPPAPAPAPAQSSPSVPALMWMSWPVQAAVRAAMPDRMIRGAALAAADALLEAWPPDDQPEWLARSLRSCADSLRLAAGALLWEGGCHPLLLRAGRSLDAARLTGPAVVYWEELAATSQRALGEDHRESLGIAERLGRAYLAAGRAAEAVSMLQWLRAEHARRQGPDHADTVTAGHDLGLALLSASRFGEAVTVLAEAVGDLERSHGADSLVTLTAREDLAAAYRGSGLSADAIALYRRTLAQREHVQGTRHADTTATRQRLAEAYLAAGQGKAAISHYERVVADMERTFARGDLRTIAARGALGAAYHAAGRMAAAVRLGEQTRTEYAQALGADHPDTLAACLNLSHAYYAVGRRGDAVKLLADTVERCDATRPTGDALRNAARISLSNVGGTGS